MDSHYNDRVAGAKTKWIIEFLKASPLPSKKPPINFLIPYPPNSREREAHLWLNTTELKGFEKKFNKFLTVINELCSSLDETYKKNLGKGSAHDTSENLKSLNELVERFNEFFKKLNEDDDKEPKSS